MNINNKLEQAIQRQVKGAVQEAIQLYEEILAEQPEHSAANHNLGILLLTVDQLESGMKRICRVLATEPDNLELRSTYRTVALRLYQDRLWEQARTWVEKALEYFPADAELKNIKERIEPRPYLKPKAYDPHRGKDLLRYSPLESGSYIYAIDIVGTCNLRCPTCPVGNFQDAERATGFMTLELFEQIITKIQREKITDCLEIWLFNWGEPLLHPKLSEFIRATKAAGFPVHLSTNLNIERGIKEVVKANPTSIKISLSGFTESTYSLTHVRGEINLVKANMYLLRHYLDKYKATTQVWVGHHLYKNNLSEVDEVAATCTSLGFAHHPIQAFYQPLEKLLDLLACNKDAHDEPVLEELITHPRDYVNRISRRRGDRYDCELRFNQTTINHDGSVALCCSVYNKPNMLSAKFLELSHDELEHLKYEHPFCKTCANNNLNYTMSELQLDDQTQSDISSIFNSKK